MHYYSFNIGDYASHTRHLDLIEDLAYRRLLDLYYLHEQPLNESPTTVARLINMRKHEKEVEAVLKEFFSLEKGRGWINLRADEEIAKYHDKIESASKAGKASAQRRLNARSTDVQLNKKQEPITSNQEPEEEEKNARKARAKPKMTIPNDLVLTQSSVEYAIDRKLNYRSEFVSFVNHYSANGKTMKDWQAAWRSWCDKAVEFGRSSQPSITKSPAKTQHQLNQEAIARSIGLIPKEPERTIIDGGVVYDITESTPKLLG